MPGHADILRQRFEILTRWREVFCTCTDDGHDPMCLGCAILRNVLRDWGVPGLEHMIRRVEAREQALRDRIRLLETQLDLLGPRGFLED